MLVTRMSGRSAGTITSVPSVRSSRKWSTLIAPTRTSRTSRCSVPRGSSSDLGAEAGGDVGDRRVGELRALRQDVDRLVHPHGLDARRDRGDVLRRDAVDDDAEDRAALVLERRPGRPDGGERLLGIAPLDDHEHGAAELVREVGVPPEVERGRGADEVGALADDEVAVALELPVGVVYALAHLLVGRHRDRLGLRERVHPFVVRVELVAAPDQLDLRVALGRRGDDRPEEAEPLHAAREQLHHAERHDRLAALRRHRGDVEVARQLPILSVGPAPTLGHVRDSGQGRPRGTHLEAIGRCEIMPLSWRGARDVRSAGSKNRERRRDGSCR